MNVALVGRQNTSPGINRLIGGKWSLRFCCSAMLAVGDLLMLAAAFLLANLLYWHDVTFSAGTTVLFTTAPLYLGIAGLHGVFHVDSVDHPWGGASRAMQAFVQAALAVFGIVYFLGVGEGFSRGVFGIGMALVLLALPFARLTVKLLASRISPHGLYSVVVIRDDVAYDRVDHEVVVTPAELGFDPQTSDPFQFHALAGAVARTDRVLIACPQERYQLWSGILKSLAISGEILTDERDHLGIIGLGSQGGRTTMIVTASPLGMGDRIVKRAFDLAVAGVALLVLSPLLVLTAIAIRLESQGPILFRQNRIGRDNRIFRVLKFRSMYAEDCDPHATRLTSRKDSRVTRVGALIRRTSIDELPQLINVLRGDMSIVGPRPHPLGARAADLLYWDVDPRYRHRHSIKPGLTGLAQIRGFRGNTERVEDLTNRVQADLEYTLRWSLWLDLQIIGRTVLVLAHPNAF